MDRAEIERRLRALEALLRDSGAEYELIPHDTTYHSAEDGAAQGVGRIEQMAPTFILESKGDYYAAIISGATRLSYQKIKKHLGITDVSLASPERVRAVTGAEVGTVSLVNPGMTTLLDERLLASGVGFGGCGVPRHTLEIRITDLVRVTRARVFDFAEPKRT